MFVHLSDAVWTLLRLREYVVHRSLEVGSLAKTGRPSDDGSSP